MRIIRINISDIKYNVNTESLIELKNQLEVEKFSDVIDEINTNLPESLTLELDYDKYLSLNEYDLYSKIQKEIKLKTDFEPNSFNSQIVEILTLYDSDLHEKLESIIRELECLLARDNSNKELKDLIIRAKNIKFEKRKDFIE